MLKTVAAFIALVTTVSAAQPPALPTPDQIVDFCESSTVAEATTKGDALGWMPLTDAAWKKSFERYNGGTVDVVGWHRGEKDEDGVLSFWISTGPTATRMCSFSANGAAPVVDAFLSRLGKPSTLDRNDVGTIVDWQRAGDVVELYQVGTLTSVSHTLRQ